MYKISLILCIAAALILLYGCAKLYYGYTKVEWEQLSSEEQNSVKAEYGQVIHYKNTMAHDKMIEDRKQQVIDLGASKSGG